MNDGRCTTLSRSENSPLARAERSHLDLLVFASACAIRWLYLLVARPAFMGDYWDLASQLRERGSLGLQGTASTAFEPLYPWFLAAFRMLVGDDPFAVQLIQVAVAAAAPVCLYHLAEALTGNRRVALLAALLLTCYPLAIRHAADGRDVALMSTLLIAFCWTCARGTSVLDAVWAGFWLGLVVLTRAMALPLVPLASLVWLWQGRARAAGALAATALIVFAPYAMRNAALNGALLPTRSGINLFVSTSEYTASLVPGHHPDALLSYANERLAGEGAPVGLPPSPDVERREDIVFRRLAWKEIVRHPIAMLGLRVKYVGYFFSPFLVPQHEALPDPADVHLDGAGHVTITNDPPKRPRWIRMIYTLSYTPVAVLAVLGAVSRRRRLIKDAVLWAVLITYVAAHAIFFPATFYRAPMDFVLLFYAAVALDYLIRRTPAIERVLGDDRL